jgi:hypothetical protein
MRTPRLTIPTLARTLAIVLAVVAFAVPVANAGVERSRTISGQTARIALPAGNTVEQWNKIAEDTVIGAGAFQIEGFIYMACESTAVYDATVALQGGYKPLMPSFRVWKGASPDAAVVEAAYRTLTHYFPAASTTLDPLYAAALAAIPDGQAKKAGQKIGWVAANQVIRARTGDGLTTPIGVTATFPTLIPGPGVWRLTPPAFLAPQTPWVANVRPFVLKSGAQFLPGPPPSLSSADWVTAFNELKTYGSATSTARTADETNIAEFWSANVPRQYNRVVRDVTDAKGLNLGQTARLAAMVNDVAADAGISVMYAKYHYLFWRPVTAIDPTSVTADGFGPTPGFDDGNAATVEQPGWRPLLVTPNHPEYPAAHGSVTGAMADVLSSALGTTQINLDIHGFDPTGPAGNLNAVQHFNTADDLRTQIVNARVWAGLHYRFSGLAGVALGTNVADYDLKHAFQPAK